MSEAILSIGSAADSLTALPPPQTLTVSLQDIDAATTTRSANGTMLRDRVAGGASAKRKLELEWPAMDVSKAKTILQAVQDEFFFVRYPDPYTGGMRTAQFYAGDRSAPMYSFNLYGRGILWRNLSFNLVEK